MINARIIRETGWTLLQLREQPAHELDQIVTVWEEEDRYAFKSSK